MSVNTNPPYNRLETILMGGTVEPPYSRRELIAMQAGAGSSDGEGGQNSPLIVTLDDNGAFDKTWKEVHDAIASGRPVYVIADNSSSTSMFRVLATAIKNGTYVALVGEIAGTDNNYSYVLEPYECESEDGYPIA